MKHLNTPLGQKVHSVDTVAEMSGLPKSVGLECVYCVGTATLYSFVDSLLVAPNGTSILATGSGGDTRWVGMGGQYNYYSSLIDITYADLVTAIGASTLIKGQRYRITDYKTVHLIPNTLDINTAGAEEIIVIALDTNIISTHALSQDHPEDLLEYDYSLNLAEDGLTSRPGLITYRKDTANDVEAYYDWRTYKFRRYPLDLTASNPSGAPYAWSAVPTPKYASFTGTPSDPGSTPVIVTADNTGVVGNSIIINVVSPDTIAAAITAWNLANPTNTVTLTAGDDTQTPSFFPMNFSGGADGIYARGDIVKSASPNLYINLEGDNLDDPDTVAGEDSWGTPFSLADSNVFAYGAKILAQSLVLDMTSPTDYLTFNGTAKNVHIGAGSLDNIFLGNCKDIQISSDCSANTFGNLSEGLNIYSSCINNIFGGFCNFLEVHSRCEYNIFGSSTQDSQFQDELAHNVVLMGTAGTKIGYKSSHNIINGACNNTTLGSNNVNNTIGKGTDFTVLGQSCVSNTIGKGRGNPICVSVNLGNNCAHIKVPAGSFNVYVAHRVLNLDLSPLSGVYNVRFEPAGVHTDFIFPPSSLYDFAGVSFAAATHLVQTYSKVVFTTSALPWVSGNSYNLGNRVVDTVNIYEIYECINPTSGTTTPSADAINWVYYGTTARLKYTDELDNEIITDVNA